ncbi:hypothetical protein ABE07_11340 [Bacillus thuringiensis]|nr:hypothetical protein [Bacillus thuringiensis]MBG9649229.1 hypothetical protein [Bacillus thuringiensis]
MTTNLSGNSVEIIVSGFGGFNGTYNLTSDIFSCAPGDALSFIAPDDVVITDIYMSVVGLAFTFPCSETTFPYVALATALPDTISFTIDLSTKIVVSAPYTPGATPANTVRSGQLINFSRYKSCNCLWQGYTKCSRSKILSFLLYRGNQITIIIPIYEI